MRKCYFRLSYYRKTEKEYIKMPWKAEKDQLQITKRHIYDRKLLKRAASQKHFFHHKYGINNSESIVLYLSFEKMVPFFENVKILCTRKFSCNWNLFQVCIYVKSKIDKKTCGYCSRRLIYIRSNYTLFQ